MDFNEALERCRQLDITAVTESFLTEADGKVVWVRDDYLCMRGISGDAKLLRFLDQVADLKEHVRAKGYVFKA